jgi:hypothetical protein
MDRKIVVRVMMPSGQLILHHFPGGSMPKSRIDNKLANL